MSLVHLHHALTKQICAQCTQVKTDQHMNKVKEQLMFEQRTIEQAEERCVLVRSVLRQRLVQVGCHSLTEAIYFCVNEMVHS